MKPSYATRNYEGGKDEPETISIMPAAQPVQLQGRENLLSISKAGKPQRNIMWMITLGPDKDQKTKK